MTVLKKKVKAYPEKNGVSIRGTEWSLWFRRVKVGKEQRDMFLIKPLRCTYNGADQTFGYDDMARPLWLTPSELGELMKALAEL